MAQPTAESLLQGLLSREAHSCPKARMRAELACEKPAWCAVRQWAVEGAQVLASGRPGVQIQLSDL